MWKYLVFVLAGWSLALAQPMAVGVMPFANNSLAEKEAMEPLTKGLADMLSTSLSKMNGMKIVERTSIEKVVREIGLAQAGLVEGPQAQAAGKMAGAQVLLLGSYNYAFNGEIRIDARLVKVETGETIKAEEVTGKREKLFQLMNKLSFKIADDLAVKLSKDEKKAVEKSDNENLDALLAFSQGLAAQDKGDLAAAKKCYEKALSINKDFTRAKSQLEIINSTITK
jgi:TolB-like protein